MFRAVGQRWQCSNARCNCNGRRCDAHRFHRLYHLDLRWQWCSCVSQRRDIWRLRFHVGSPRFSTKRWWQVRSHFNSRKRSVSCARPVVFVFLHMTESTFVQLFFFESRAWSVNPCCCCRSGASRRASPSSSAIGGRAQRGRICSRQRPGAIV